MLHQAHAGQLRPLPSRPLAPCRLRPPDQPWLACSVSGAAHRWSSRLRCASCRQLRAACRHASRPRRRHRLAGRGRQNARIGLPFSEPGRDLEIRRRSDRRVNTLFRVRTRYRELTIHHGRPSHPVWKLRPSFSREPEVVPIPACSLLSAPPPSFAGRHPRPCATPLPSGI